MQCPNCGAALTGKELHCPYCGWENPKQAEENQKEKIAFIYRKAAELFHLPERLVKKICHWLLVIAGAVLAVYLLLLIGKSAIASHHADNSYQIQQENLAKLESYYQAGEFEEMRDYLYDIDGYYRATYSKYYIIGNIAETLASTRKSLEIHHEYKAEYLTAELLSWDVSSLIERLAQIRELEEKGFVYGEKEEALYFKEEIEALIRRELYLTDEEIEAAIPLADDEDEMLALAEVCRQRILEEQAK